MKFGDDERGRRRESYHHGNLREVLIAAALTLIAERGPAGFTFAEVARAAGVSPAAPYRHFRDRNALVAELARQGFERFTADLESAWNGGRPDPIAALENCGRAYLAFARREPASYAAMFETGFALEEDAMLLAASERAFAVLRRAADRVCDLHKTGSGGSPRPPALMVALHIWAMAHGIASLFVGRLDTARRKLPMTPEELLESGVLIYLQSLAIIPAGE